MGRRQLQSIRIGELLTSLGLVSTRDLNEALQISRDTGLPVGRVLTHSSFITEAQLQGALKAQSLLNDGLITMDQVAKAMDLSILNSVPFDEALVKTGWVDRGRGSSKLGELLVGAELTTEDQMEGALRQSITTGLPMGRLLVLSGVLSDSLLAAALTAQILVRDGKLTKEDAIASLKAAKGRQVPIEVPLAEKGFYELPSRKGVRLGDLLAVSGLVSESEVLSAVEVGLLEQKPIGQVLVERSPISETVLEAALKLQKEIAAGKVEMDQAAQALFLVHADGISLQAAMAKMQTLAPKKDGTPPLAHFLRLVRSITSDDIKTAMEYAIRDPEIFTQVSVKSGILDEKTIQIGQACEELMRKGVLNLERACILFDYAKRKDLSVEAALAELSWHQRDGELPEPAKETDGTEADTAQPAAIWEELRGSAEEASSVGDALKAEDFWRQAVKVAQSFGESDSKYTFSLDCLADSLFQQRKYEQAERLFKRAYEIRVNTLGPAHISIATSLNNLAKLYYFEGRYDLAEPIAREFVVMCQRLYGAEHPDVACGIHNLATLYHTSGRYDQAEVQYKRAIEICAKSLSPEHPATIRLLRSYASLLKATDRAEEAERLDVYAQGVITGSWKVLSIPQHEMLSGEGTEANKQTQPVKEG
jgi:tetratricopeptide (TPR) repeat protein